MTINCGKFAAQCLAAAILAAIIALPNICDGAPSEVIFGNLQTPDVGLTANSHSWSSLSFVTGAVQMQLDSIDVRLLPHESNVGNFVVRLFGNGLSSNVPGTQLETLIGPNTPNFGTFHYSSSTNSVLLPNTPYWIVFSGTVAEHSYAVGGEIRQRGIAIGSTLGGQYTIDSGANWVAVSYIINMQVSGTPIPEPSTLALTVLALAALPVRRRKRTLLV